MRSQQLEKTVELRDRRKARITKWLHSETRESKLATPSGDTDNRNPCYNSQYKSSRVTIVTITVPIEMSIITFLGKACEACERADGLSKLSAKSA